MLLVPEITTPLAPVLFTLRVATVAMGSVPTVMFVHGAPQLLVSLDSVICGVGFTIEVPLTVLSAQTLTNFVPVELKMYGYETGPSSPGARADLVLAFWSYIPAPYGVFENWKTFEKPEPVGALPMFEIVAERRVV